MRSNALRIITLTVFICSAADCSVFAAAPSVRATAAVDRDTATIGDTIQYTIEVTAGDDSEVAIVAFTEDVGGLAIRDFETSQKTFFGTTVYRQKYLLTTYTIGPYTIPRAVVRYRTKDLGEWQELRTDEITIEVQSVLGAGAETTDIRDIKGPRGFPRPWWQYLVLGTLLLLVCLGLIAWLLGRKKKTKRITRFRPAHEIAYEELRELRRKNLIAQGRIKEYFFELSLIVRQYLERRFTLRAPEMTTEEFLSHLKDSPVLSDVHKKLLKDFLVTADLVKFAKYGPTGSEIQASIEAAQRLVDQTRQEPETARVTAGKGT
jgi:hypothetical protein